MDKTEELKVEGGEERSSLSINEVYNKLYNEFLKGVHQGKLQAQSNFKAKLNEIISEIDENILTDMQGQLLPGCKGLWIAKKIITKKLKELE
jgi:hypothetical protein